MSTKTLTDTDINARKRAVGALFFCMSPVGKKAIRDLVKAERTLEKIEQKRAYVSEIIVSMNLTGIDGAPVTSGKELWLVSDSPELTACLDRIRRADIANGFKCVQDGKCPKSLASMEVSRLEQVIAVGMFGENLYGAHLEEAIRIAKSAP